LYARIFEAIDCVCRLPLDTTRRCFLWLRLWRGDASNIKRGGRFRCIRVVGKSQRLAGVRWVYYFRREVCCGTDMDGAAAEVGRHCARPRRKCKGTDGGGGTWSEKISVHTSADSTLMDRCRSSSSLKAMKSASFSSVPSNLQVRNAMMHLRPRYM
jgi:hypothetical protein